MYVKVKVQTGAKREVIQALSLRSLQISVKEKPLKNLANHRVLKLVAAYFNVPVARVRILRGHRAPSKLLSITV